MTNQTIVPVVRPERLDPAERARWELSAMAGRLRVLELQLAEAQLQAQRLRRERDRLRDAGPNRVTGPFRALRKRLRGGKEADSPVAPTRSKRTRGSTTRSSTTESWTTESWTTQSMTAGGTTVRGMRALTATVQGTTTQDAGTDNPASELSANNPRRLPARLYVAVGLKAGAVQDFVLTLQQRMLVAPDHRPVVLTDSPEFARLRDQGVLLEYLPDRATWNTHRPDRPWDDLLAQRLARLGRDHDAVRTTVVDAAQPPTLADLLR